jgi:protein-tyrosine phosphatase
MAEALLSQALAPQGITVRSAGLAALVDYPADETAVELMEERGIDITGHRARQLYPDLLAEADLVLVMEKAHKRAIEQNEPEARGKIFRFCEWRDTDVPDPYRQPREAFEEALRLIDAGVADWKKKIVGAARGRDPE